MNTYVHVLFASEQCLARRVKQQNALNQIQRTQDQKVVLSITATRQQTIQGLDQPRRDIPLEALLQLEELAKSRVVGQLREVLLVRRFLSSPLVVDLGARSRRCRRRRRLGRRGRGGLGRGFGKADLRKKTFDLAQALANLGAVVGREVVECEGE